MGKASERPTAACGLRFVIYPLFEADEAATTALLDALADAMVAAHGNATNEDDSVRSIIVVETTDESVGTEAWLEKIARSDQAIRIVMPGAPVEPEWGPRHERWELRGDDDA